MSELLSKPDLLETCTPNLSAAERALLLRPADAPWTEGRAVNPRELSSRSRFPDTVVTSALRRLRDAGILGWGEHRWVVPGPQFLRLTEHVQQEIFQDLVLLAEPTGALADSIRRSRAARLDGSTR